MFKCEVIGNIGADVEIKESNGSKFAAFRVAHSESYNDANGQKHEVTQWIDVILNDPESKLMPYLNRGTKVYVRGNARVRAYSSRTARAFVAGVTINAVEIELCGGVRDEVPAQLINPETGAMFNVTKYYWCDKDTKGMKQDEMQLLVDTKGKEYGMNSQGFVAPVPAEVRAANEGEKVQVDSGQKKK